MNILAIDSASSAISLAVSKGDEIICHETALSENQSEYIMAHIDEIVKKALLKPENLNCILCMNGPGSFTGLRIGFSIAKAISLSLNIPFFPISTLETIAFGCETKTISVIKAVKGAFFYAIFENGCRLTQDAEAKTEEFQEIIANNSPNNDKITINGHGARELCEYLPNLMPYLGVKADKIGYSKELIHIAKTKEIIHNDYNLFLHSGPDYIRRGS